MLRFFQRFFSKKDRHPLMKDGIYIGRKCELCGAIVKGGTKAKHMHGVHPEYAFTDDHSTYIVYYRCKQCGSSCGGIKGIINHYKQYHPDKLLKVTT